MVVTTCVTTIFLWTSLGLNQGPPDYETLIISFGNALILTKIINSLITGDETIVKHQLS